MIAKRHLLLAVAATLFSAGVAFANDAPPQGMMPHQGMMMPPPGMQPGMQQAELPKSPVEFHKLMCSEHFARESGKMAYLEAKLNLTDKQKTAWSKYSAVQLQSAAQQRDVCLSLTPKTDAKPSALEIQAMQEKELTQRLQALQAERPALQALYELLSPEQKAILDQPPHHGGGHGEHGHHGQMG